MKTFPTSAVWCLGILFISVSLITTGSSEVQVVGPADPVVALAGDDIILPCSLKPSVSAEEMVVEWTRSNLRKENVHLYRQGRDSNVEQHPSYRGRTSMFHEELKNGNVSLKLTRVTLSDAGSYRCFIPTLTSQVKETTVQLLVGAVSQPVISIDGTKGWGVVLKCESGGWFPEPEMEWLDSSGTILPADGPPEIHRDPEGLYAVRRHVTVNQTDTNRFTCRVKQPEFNHLKETEIHVPDEVFPKSQVGFIVGLIAAAVVVLTASAGGVYWWRKHKEEQRQRWEELRDAWFVTRHKDDLIQKVSKGKSIASELHQKDLIPDEMNSQISAARTRQDQMRLLFLALEEAEDTTRVKSAFYRILLDLEPDIVKDLNICDDLFDICDDLFEEKQRQRLEELCDARFVDRHKDDLIQMVSKGKFIASELHKKDLIPDEMNSQISAAATSQDQMRLLFKALEEAEDTTRVKSAFYRILLDLEPYLVYHLDIFDDLFGEALFVTRHKDHLIQRVSEGKSIASELHQKDLIPDEMNSRISAARTSQDQMRLLFLALEEAENTTRVKSAFYRILLDLEPDIVKDLGGSDDAISGSDDDIGGSDDDIENLKKEIDDVTRERDDVTRERDDVTREREKLKKEIEKLKKENEVVTREREKRKKENDDVTRERDDVTRERDELKEELRKAEETNQSLSTSPDGQQKTQTPSQKSEGIEGMEMESLPGRKSGPGPGRKSAPGPGRESAPEMKPLLAAGPQKDDLDELERGGRDTTEFNYRETIPSGRKSGPEKEMEMKPLLGPGPQKDDLDELERGGRVTTEFNYVL